MNEAHELIRQMFKKRHEAAKRELEDAQDRWTNDEAPTTHMILAYGKACYTFGLVIGLRVGKLTAEINNSTDPQALVDLVEDAKKAEAEFSECFESLIMRRKGSQERRQHEAGCECVPCKLIAITKV